MKRNEMLSYTAEDINNMNKQELIELGKAERKAIKDAKYRLIKSDVQYSPALNYLNEKGNISIKKSMSINELRREITKGRVILQMKTLYVKDARKLQKDMIDTLSARLGSTITPEQSKLLWQLIDRVKDTEPVLLHTGDLSYIPKEIQQRVFQTMVESDSSTYKSVDKLFESVMETLENDYMERELNESGYYDNLDEDGFYSFS